MSVRDDLISKEEVMAILAKEKEFTLEHEHYNADIMLNKITRSIDRLKLYQGKDKVMENVPTSIPVPFGSTVYFIYGDKVYEEKVMSFTWDKDGCHAFNEYEEMIGTWGESVFATQEEANLALAEKQTSKTEAGLDR